MNKIDYKIFVPRGENNYVKFDTETEFEIDEIISINLFLSTDKVIYWLYIKIPENDEHHKLLLRKGKKPKLTLLIGNNPYEIIGEAEVENISYQNWEENILVTLSFVVSNASQTVKNKRKTIKYERSELLDIREDE